MVKQYRKKPIVVEALQYYDNFDEVSDFIQSRTQINCSVMNFDSIDTPGTRKISIVLPNGQGLLVEPGDYIVFGVDGSTYPVKKEIFEKVYDEVTSDNSVIWW